MRFSRSISMRPLDAIDPIEIEIEIESIEQGALDIGQLQALTTPQQTAIDEINQLLLTGQTLR